MPKIGDAPSGENSSLDGTEKVPLTGSKFTLISTIKNYVKTITDTLYSSYEHTHADSDHAGVVAHSVLSGIGTGVHVPSYSSDSTTYLNGNGEWTAPPSGGTVYDSDIVRTDTTANNADSDAHGFLLKLSMDTSQFMRGDGSWQTPAGSGTVYDSDIVLQAITTNNADSDHHGFMPTLSGDSDTWLDGKGAYTTPPSSGGGGRTLIATSSPSGTGTVSFTSIPGTYVHLEIDYAARSTKTSVEFEAMFVEFNADTTSTNYRYIRNFVFATGTFAGDGGDGSIIDDIPAANGLANNASRGIMHIEYYTETTFHKDASVRTANRRNTGSVQMLDMCASVNWESAVAITQVDFKLASGNFVAGSIFNLYGLT